MFSNNSAFLISFFAFFTLFHDAENKFNILFPRENSMFVSQIVLKMNVKIYFENKKHEQCNSFLIKSFRKREKNPKQRLKNPTWYLS